MYRSAKDWIDSLPPDEREAVDRRVAELQQERAAFQDVQVHGREARAAVAAELEVSPDALDQMLEAADRYIEVLQERVAPHGGSVALKVDMPGHETVLADRLRDLHDADG